MANPHVLYALQSGVPGLFDEITQFKVNKNTAQSIQGADGGIEPRLISKDQQAPTLEFGSLAVARCLALCGVNGLAIGVTPADMYFQRMELDGARSSGTNHMRGRVNKGLFLPVRLRAEQGKPAVIEYALHTRYVSGTNPIAWTAAVALAGSPAFDEVFTLGPVTINGAALPNVQGVEVDFGLEPFKQWSGGEIWPEFLSILNRNNAKIRIRTREAVAENTYGLVGTAIDAEDGAVVYFRKKSPDGAGNVANATEEHVSISVTAGVVDVPTNEAQHPDPFDANVEITPRWDGTNSVLAVSTATAIA